VNPLAVPSIRNQTSLPEVCQMTGDRRLRLIKDIDEEADANLAFGHEIQEAKARPVAERREESFERQDRRGRTLSHIRIDKCIWQAYLLVTFAITNIKEIDDVRKPRSSSTEGPCVHQRPQRRDEH
jgi:hypothetical protein